MLEHLLFISIGCGIVSFVWTNVLIMPDHLFGKIFGWIEKLLTRTKTVAEYIENPEEIARMTGEKYRTKETKVIKRSWILKPLGGCSICFAGQLSLWVSFFNNFNFMIIILNICISITIVKALQKMLN